MRLNSVPGHSLTLILSSLIFPALLLGADLQINEFMAANDRTLADPQGEYDDWIEIHNTTDQPLDLAGYYLTDDVNAPMLWQVPAGRPEETTVPPGDFLIVWADNDANDSGLHAGFKLSAGGEQVALYDRDGVTLLESVTFGPQQEDISYGRLFNMDVVWQFFDKPSPLANNTAGYMGLVADTRFSVDRGFYDEPVTVAITCDTPEAVIYYTLNGADPFDAQRNQAHGQIYTEPLTLATTTCLRAAATRQGWKTTDVDTHTYLFLEDVIRQPVKPMGYPTNWGHAGGDYAMDAAVVNDPLYQDRLIPALEAIASLSLVMNQDSWFGPDGEGIYLQGQNDPRAVSAELLLPDGEPGFQINCSVEIVGGSSPSRWKMDKLSMRLKFQREYGPSKLRYPVFGEDATDAFDTLVVDARMNNTWPYGGGVTVNRDGERLTQRDTAQYTRDQYVADLQLAAGGWAPHGRSIHLYVNGLYWGLYRLHERPDEHFAATYLGGNNEDYDVLKHSSSNVVHGSRDNYRALLDLVSGDMQSLDRFEAIQEHLDIRSLMDYILINYYVGNSDWAHHNWYASYNTQDPLGRWQFHSWDAEHSMEALYYDNTGRNNSGGPTGVHHRLMANSTYHSIFQDRVRQHCFDGGLLTPEGAAFHYQKRLDEIDLAIIAESARWGDNHSTVPYTRDIDWILERDWQLQTFFPQRTDVLLGQLRARGWFPEE